MYLPYRKIDRFKYLRSLGLSNSLGGPISVGPDDIRSDHMYDSNDYPQHICFYDQIPSLTVLLIQSTSGHGTWS